MGRARGTVALGARLCMQARVASDVVWIASVAHKKRPRLSAGPLSVLL